MSNHFFPITHQIKAGGIPCRVVAKTKNRSLVELKNGSSSWVANFDLSPVKQEQNNDQNHQS